MAEYKIIPDGLNTFGVEITSIGRFLSVRGFPTEKAAQAWIDEQQHAEMLAAHAAKLPAAQEPTIEQPNHLGQTQVNEGPRRR
jgi:hypothetical protein